MTCPDFGKMQRSRGFEDSRSLWWCVDRQGEAEGGWVGRRAYGGGVAPRRITDPSYCLKQYFEDLSTFPELNLCPDEIGTGLARAGRWRRRLQDSWPHSERDS